MANPGKFIQEVRSEASKITWPTRKETIQTTIMVLIMATLVAIFLYLADQVLSTAVRQVIELFS